MKEPINAIPYGRQEITQADIEAVVAALKSDFLTQGPRIEAFEQAFALYMGAPYAVAVANGTAALHLSALALGVQPGTKVITSPITFAASANAVLYAGGEVAFCDIDPKTYLLDLNKLQTMLAKAPAGTYQGVIPVDYAGYPVPMAELKELCDRYGLWILEDACHAPGGQFKDPAGNLHRCGDCTYADAAIFSFHPVKHIAAGEGGMVTTSRKDIYEKLLLLRTHGITKSPGQMQQNDGGWYYEMQALGFNYRLTDIQAALGLSQLDRAKINLQKRRWLAERYDERLEGLDNITTPTVSETVRHAYHLYVIRTAGRKALYDYLREHQIMAQVHYVPVHLHPYYRRLGWKKGDFPVAETFYEQCLSLPMYPSLTLAEQDYVIETIVHFQR